MVNTHSFSSQLIHVIVDGVYYEQKVVHKNDMILWFRMNTIKIGKFVALGYKLILSIKFDSLQPIKHLIMFILKIECFV